ncbi:MAG TPA: LysR family transcriptional regulator, partial [Virgibacillus sp.]|nr:LysR family transcriptional regulator [Virgibacillus sp.]
MDFRLKLFTTVAEEESFSKAANKMHISQPAVSMQIKTLEEKYGVPLFERSHRAIKLTKAGEILYHHANKIIY